MDDDATFRIPRTGKVGFKNVFEKGVVLRKRCKINVLKAYVFRMMVYL